MANTGFTVNAHRVDPYKNFKFVVYWDNKAVLGVSKVGALKRTTEVVKHRSGGENSYDHKSPGRTTYDAITLERGITWDDTFVIWANMVHTFAGDPAIDLAGYKKDLTVELLNEKGQPVKRYFLYGCWVSSTTQLPDLDGNANATAIESLTIEIEGFDRDTALTEQSEAA